ncbi:MAG: hypothetical protein JNJ88_18960 [Planctomycetes bacterium]|nr:hypothetical protein [Planctomycetota bacterium]
MGRLKLLLLWAALLAAVTLWPHIRAALPIEPAVLSSWRSAQIEHGIPGLVIRLSADAEERERQAEALAEMRDGDGIELRRRAAVLCARPEELDRWIPATSKRSSAAVIDLRRGVLAEYEISVFDWRSSPRLALKLRKLVERAMGGASGLVTGVAPLQRHDVPFGIEAWEEESDRDWVADAWFYVARHRAPWDDRHFPTCGTFLRGGPTRVLRIRFVGLSGRPD